MTLRAELALTLSRTDLDKLIKEADYAKVIQMLQTPHSPLSARTIALK